MYSDHSLVVAVNLPLPSSEVFLQGVNSRFMPEALALVGACLGVMLAILLIRSLRNG